MSAHAFRILIRQTLLLCVLVMLNACKPAADSRASGSVKHWPYVEYARVVGYYFVDGRPRDTLSVMKNGGDGLDEEELRKWKQQEKTLTASQTTRFLQASFESKFRFSQAACYDPHHVFVFYNAQGKVVAACEVCLSCKAFIEWPANESVVHEHSRPVDYLVLAKLCSELGLKLGPAREATHGPLKGEMVEPSLEGVVGAMMEQRFSVE